MYAHDSGTMYLLERIGFVLQYDYMTEILAESMICGIPLNCDFSILNRSDFELDNAKLKAINSDQVLEEDSFFIQEERVYACNMFNHSRPKSHIQTFFKYDHIQGILTYVTSGVSMVSLLITLVVYALLPELRNLPGRLTMSLSATLLVAQTLLLLIHLPTGLLCQALAITLHFSWLCSFMWMTVMSVSLAHTFQNKTKQALAQRANKTYALFSLLAFGIPALIVGVSVVIDLLDVPGLDIGYGSSGVCWISNPSASLLVFGLPVGLSIAANTISFVVTYYNIDKSLKLSKNVSSTGKDKSRFLIYSKLFIIMGLTWGFSFIAGFANVTSLWYIFIIMNGLQGFYILCSFICTDRVKLMLRKKLTGKESRHDVTSTVYTTAST
ncbi:probable G-protein coupled receptor Mth-like 1 [Haliotis rubra]|uniref:probable G-protein coupled receptor Mth-like 1 n=1 Tax=Haliotis rubra TaxID=36100 RepID=UPI001EE505F5|nr:probable G-protein coupled receptor Mth-like 1 [Haliotis rubra]XP_046583684.1 probable G-protein coupled receptor Mth-like 1 [Haliotis rubra]